MDGCGCFRYVGVELSIDAEVMPLSITGICSTNSMAFSIFFLLSSTSSLAFLTPSSSTTSSFFFFVDDIVVSNVGVNNSSSMTCLLLTLDGSVSLSQSLSPWEVSALVVSSSFSSSSSSLSFIATLFFASSAVSLVVEVEVIATAVFSA